nr:GNAT family N-acetyltransferase [Lachnospiraceae bacterium]
MTQILAITESNHGYFEKIIPDMIREIANSEGDVVAFGIVSDGAPVGAIAVKHSDQLAELLWFYIDPKFRQVGVGRESLFILCYTLKAWYGTTSIESIIPADADGNVRKLFESYHAIIEKQPECRFDTTLGEFLNAKKIKGNPAKCVSLEKTSGSLLRMLCNKIVEQGIDLVEMPIRQE